MLRLGGSMEDRLCSRVRWCNWVRKGCACQVIKLLAGRWCRQRWGLVCDKVCCFPHDESTDRATCWWWWFINIACPYEVAWLERYRSMEDDTPPITWHTWIGKASNFAYNILKKYPNSLVLVYNLAILQSPRRSLSSGHQTGFYSLLTIAFYSVYPV